VKAKALIAVALVLEACSGDSSNQNDAGNDASIDVTQDVAKNNDASANDASQNDASGNDASDGSCPAAWTDLPDAGAALAVPDGGGNVLIHAAGSGTQNYTCEGTTTDAGTSYAWTFVGPAATLDDCASNLIGHHFASEAGAAAPEWETLDNSYVIGHKIAAYTPDGGASAVPWLLLQASSSGGSGTIAQTLYVQRLFTSGGIAPTTTCDNTTAGTSVQQPYTADYYFYGP
jgi:hypothetical protein